MRGGFLTLINFLNDIEGIGISKLDNSDIIRNPIIGKILSRLEVLENEVPKS
jgi:phosphate starvation-inducible protein PhoH